jgi:hypothetical protein
MPQSDLSEARALAEEAWEREERIAVMEERLTREKAELDGLLTGRIPDLMNEAGLSEFIVQPNGNQPGLKIDVRPYYAAAVRVGWPEEKREAAFAVLPYSIVRVLVTAHFAKGEEAKAKKLASKLVKEGHTVTTRKDVNAATLKAWLRETSESGGELPDLELIEGRIGQKAKIQRLTNT